MQDSETSSTQTSKEAAVFLYHVNFIIKNVIPAKNVICCGDIRSWVNKNYLIESDTYGEMYINMYRLSTEEDIKEALKVIKDKITQGAVLGILSESYSNDEWKEILRQVGKPILLYDLDGIRIFLVTK